MMTGGPHFKPAKPPVEQSFRGDIAEVWHGETEIGRILSWNVHGANGDWSGDALKYRMHTVGGGEVEFRFFLTGPGGARITLLGYGHIVGDPVADGELHREGVQLKGTRLEVA